MYALAENLIIGTLIRPITGDGGARLELEDDK